MAWITKEDLESKTMDELREHIALMPNQTSGRRAMIELERRLHTPESVHGFRISMVLLIISTLTLIVSIVSIFK